MLGLKLSQRESVFCLQVIFASNSSSNIKIERMMVAHGQKSLMNHLSKDWSSYWHSMRSEKWSGDCPGALWNRLGQKSPPPLNSLSIETPRTPADHLVPQFVPICETCSAQSRAEGRWDFQFIEGRSRILPAGLTSPLWRANLVWPLLPSPVSRVQITVHQSGGFVTVELWQRRNSWTWTSTTRGITGPSVKTWVRINFCIFFAKDKLQLRSKAVECARVILSTCFPGPGRSEVQVPKPRFDFTWAKSIWEHLLVCFLLLGLTEVSALSYLDRLLFLSHSYFIPGTLQVFGSREVRGH